MGGRREASVTCFFWPTIEWVQRLLSAPIARPPPPRRIVLAAINTGATSEPQVAATGLPA